jgi:hypothetical protein
MSETPNATPNTASLVIAGKIPLGVRLPKPQVQLPEPQVPSLEVKVASPEVQVPLPEPKAPLAEMQVPLPASPVAQPALSETIEGYIVAYHYAALTNLFCQIYLPFIEQVEDNDVVKAIIDTSYRDFYMLDSWLGALDPKEIQANPRSHLYQETRDVWRDWIKDWTTISKGNQQTG